MIKVEENKEVQIIDLVSTHIKQIMFFSINNSIIEANVPARTPFSELRKFCVYERTAIMA